MKRSRRILISLIVCSCIWMVLELASYLVLRFSFNGERIQQLTPILIRDPKLFWRLHPGVDIRYEGIQIRVDANGFRGDYPPSLWERPQRILCLGDSVTFGWQVEESDTYPNQLQQRLDTEAPGMYTVFNAGVPGHTSFQGVQRLPDLLRLVDPAVVIVSYSINDRFSSNMTDAHRYYRFERMKRLLRLSRVVRLLENTLTSGNPTRFNPKLTHQKNGTGTADFIDVGSGNDEAGEVKRVMPASFRNNLKQIVDHCRLKNKRVILLNEYVNYLPSLYDAYHEETRSVAELESLSLIDAVGILKPLDIHSSAKTETGKAAGETIRMNALIQLKPCAGMEKMPVDGGKKQPGDGGEKQPGDGVATKEKPKDRP
ncbi:hypothetical protein JXA80_01330, partial [bacterium]|nr:hypothetical protein [candidate division CSSED10-310 bacterium]